MNRGRITPWKRGWIAVAGTAATYFFFLLFAEFAFLELAGGLFGNANGQRGVMAVLGISGVVGGAVVVRIYSAAKADELLSWSFRTCATGALAALGAQAAQSIPLMILAGAVTGAALGALTVTLASVLRAEMGDARLGLGIGVGTGFAYALCNVPWVFHASAVAQTGLAALVAGAASFLPRIADAETPTGGIARLAWSSLACWIGILLALVWLDSAAFYIVQHTDALRAETWTGNRTLLGNAATHLVVAVFAGWLLDRGHRGWVVGAAVFALAAAGLQLNGTLPASLSPNWPYTAGVSLYSVALVELPARSGKPWLAALVFGIAGWMGSALGIGMAQDLAAIPTAFVGTALGVVLLGLFWTRRQAAAVATIMVAASVTVHADDLVGIGREVYIAEGCIHCHSQYIRPRVAAEVLNWGPATPWRETLSATPPLIGTRRQGPDLSHVGNRRSPEWNRLHLISPQTVSPGSRMPSYAHLFASDAVRGDALLAYLSSLGADTMEERRAQTELWQPDASQVISPVKAEQLFGRLCAQCHGPAGRGDGKLALQLSPPPPDWSRSAWRHVKEKASVDATLSRIIKFGLPGLPMAGHESLPDREIVGLARYVERLHESPSSGAPPAAQP